MTENDSNVNDGINHINNNTSSSSTTNNSNNNNDILYASFRQKTIDMKHWIPLPDSMPSNRDRLELYALHRQAVSGDAPMISTQQQQVQQWNATDRAKYNAWKSKSGMNNIIAMQLYIQEADRQIRVYGTSSTTESTDVQSKSMNGSGITNTTTSNSNGNTSSQPPNGSAATTATTNTSSNAIPTSRGLAAIPLLCAAASEQRVSYLRRIQSTTYNNAWWKRQEPLLATPHTLFAIPEHILLYIATCIETISLYVTYSQQQHNEQQANTSSSTTTTNTVANTSGSTSSKGNNNTKASSTATAVPSSQPLIPFIVGTTIQSYLWPLHNILLSLWITIIILYMICTSTIQCTITILFGSRRTGYTLTTIYYYTILFIHQSILTMIESHQPISIRCIGLLFTPYTFIIRFMNTFIPIQQQQQQQHTNNTEPPYTQYNSTNNSLLLLTSCSIYSCFISFTVWYWYIMIPFITLFGMTYLCSIVLLGPCYAIIEFASHL